MRLPQFLYVNPQILHARMAKRWRICAASVLCTVACMMCAPLAVSKGPNANGRWVSAWQGSPTPGDTFDSPSCPSDVGLNDQTVRNAVYVSAGGAFVRARISNAAGSDPLKVGAASIAISAGGAATVPGTLHMLRFSGKTTILVAAGGEAVSDPVALRVEALQTLAVSIYLPDNTGPATQHYFAQQDNFVGAGDQSSSRDGTGLNQPISCWMFLSGIEVNASPQVTGALIT